MVRFFTAILTDVYQQLILMANANQQNMNRNVFRSIYNFKVDQNKRMMCATRKKKRNGKTIEKFNRIKDILSDFDTLSPDEHISSLCTTLERLGSL